MVRADPYPGHLHSVFSRARPAPGAGAHHDARSRGRNAGVVHKIDAARGGARLQLRLSASTKEKMAADFWTNVRRGDAEPLSAPPVQPQLRRASRRLVRPGPSGRRFRGDVRDLAHARARLAQALRRLEGIAKTRIPRGIDAVAGGG